jgi:hypothetical protein
VLAELLALPIYRNPVKEELLVSDRMLLLAVAVAVLMRTQVRPVALLAEMLVELLLLELLEMKAVIAQ